MEISKKTQIPLKSVERIISNFKKTGDILRAKGSGRKKVVTDAEKRKIPKILNNKKITQSGKLALHCQI